MESDLLLTAYLKRLRLPTLAANYLRFAQEAAKSNQSFERYLLALIEAEVQHRETNSERKRIGQARFPTLKMLDAFDFSAIPAVNKQIIGAPQAGRRGELRTYPRPRSARGHDTHQRHEGR